MPVGELKQPRGFTLIELLVTLMIATIIAVMAVPAFNGFLARQQLASDVNEMISVLSFARSEAIKQRQPITVQFASSNACPEVRGLVNEEGSSTRWCYWVEQSGTGNETLRVGQAVNITSPTQAFSFTFQSLGNADVSDCRSTPCYITIGPQRESDSVTPITLIVNITGSIRRQESEL